MRCTDNQELDRRRRRARARKTQQTHAVLMVILLACLLLLAAVLVFRFVFRTHELSFTNPYNITSSTYGVREGISVNGRARPFTDGLCVAFGAQNADVALEAADAGALMDLTHFSVLYEKNLYERLYPASLTKIMTALVALKYGNLDDVITIDEAALDIDPDSSVCYLQLGDTYTLRQLLYGLLIASGNDAGNAIAQHVGGSIGGFVDMMNEEAYLLGATGTHFTNAHGLQDELHYTTPYDTYLMFQAAMQYDVFLDAISKQSYTVTYRGADGEAYERTWNATNYYFTGEATAPEGVAVFGGKTGTTDEAGACLCLLAKDIYGNAYFAILMHAYDRPHLYEDMNRLLAVIAEK